MQKIFDFKIYHRSHSITFPKIFPNTQKCNVVSFITKKEKLNIKINSINAT